MKMPPYRSGFRGPADCRSNIPRNRAEGNTCNSWFEKAVLYRRMATGYPLRFKFIDPRNTLIFSSLAWLQIQTCGPGPGGLIRYLEDCGELEKAGGREYVRSVFKGLL